MRVSVNTIDEFCEELQADYQAVHRGIVRVSIDYLPEQDEAVSFAVRVWATALILTEDGDYVLEFGGIAGCDEGESEEGTEQANQWREAVEHTAKQCTLTVRGGKIEVW